MKEKVFTSFLANKFLSLYLESAYEVKSKNTVFKNPKWFSFILLILSITSSILIYIVKNFQSYKAAIFNPNDNMTEYIIYLITALFFVITVLSCCVKKYSIFLKIITLFSSYAVCFILFFLSISLTFLYPKDSQTIIYCMIYTEFLIRICLIHFICIEFLDQLY